jgi:hypothetical protein
MQVVRRLRKQVCITSCSCVPFLLHRALNTSTADWNVVVGHHPMVSGAPTTYGFASSDASASSDLGWVDAFGNKSWQVVSVHGE